jgi:hypothetical protein
VKYLFKYIYKGHKLACITVDDMSNTKSNVGVDKIKQYRDTSWITPPKALWRFYGFDWSENHPPMVQLHLLGQHLVGYHENQSIELVLGKTRVRKINAYRVFPEEHKDVKVPATLYSHFPEVYTQNSEIGEKFW